MEVHVYDRVTRTAARLEVATCARDPFPHAAAWWAELDALAAIAKWTADHHGRDYYSAPDYYHVGTRTDTGFYGRAWVTGTLADPAPIPIRFTVRY